MRPEIKMLFAKISKKIVRVQKRLEQERLEFWRKYWDCMNQQNKVFMKNHTTRRDEVRKSGEL